MKRSCACSSSTSPIPRPSARAGGTPGLPGDGTDAENRLKLKPQNLLQNLPSRSAMILCDKLSIARHDCGDAVASRNTAAVSLAQAPEKAEEHRGRQGSQSMPRWRGSRAAAWRGQPTSFAALAAAPGRMMVRRRSNRVQDKTQDYEYLRLEARPDGNYLRHVALG